MFDKKEDYIIEIGLGIDIKIYDIIIIVERIKLVLNHKECYK
jgi:hypothetical protein